MKSQTEITQDQIENIVQEQNQNLADLQAFTGRIGSQRYAVIYRKGAITEIKELAENEEVEISLS